MALTTDEHAQPQAPEATKPPFRLGNRPALTGLRAPTMAFVLIFHSNFQTLPGAWLSLGVFFVLSGFLITTMLLSEHQRDSRISVSKFYGRRATRLLPPLVVAVVLLGLYAWIVPVQNAAQRIWGDSAAAVFYYSDYRSAFGHEPFGGFMAQCWSLAVEEQFYIVWCVLLVVALKFGHRKAAYAVAIGGVVLSGLDRIGIVLAAPHWNSVVAGRVYYAFDTRADAIFLGCILGLIATGGHLDDWPQWAQRLLTASALVATGVMVWVLVSVGLASRWLPLVWIPVIDVAAVVLILYFVIRTDGWGTRLMGLSVLVLLGNMSYAVYILHWPVYVAISPFTVHWPFAVEESVRLVIILSLAAASWFLLERPLMRWRRRHEAAFAPPIPGSVLIGTSGPGASAHGDPGGVAASSSAAVSGS